MSDIIINTENNSFNYIEKDPNSMSGEEWIKHQLSQGEYISGKGLVNIVNEHLTGDVVGCEVGVCLGVTSEYYAQNIKTLKKLYCVDSYPEYVDWTGVVMNREKQDAMKQHAFDRLKRFHDKIEFVYDDSENFSKRIENETLDFIFIDADHSYEGALSDFKLYFPLVKKGGIFAGHDFPLQGVNGALKDFLVDRFKEIKMLENNAWYLIK
jgi:predicted O-methyltransferase YrrM